MYPFIETIMIRDGELQNMKHHQERFERTRRDVLHASSHPLLEEYIRIPFDLPPGILKCRVLYGETIGEISIGPYARPQIRSLQLVYNNDIDYNHKAADRTALTELFLQKGDCDDILIVKNGVISDSFMANVVFHDGERWYTPDSPLLPGCMRAQLLAGGRIREARISPADLQNYRKIRLINALNDLDEGIELPVEAVRT